jgi:SAM-dependent methyltransferase
MADQGSEGMLSPYLRRKRMQAAAPFLSGRVLDYGCGSGALAMLIDADNYLGVEIDGHSLQNAKRAFAEHRFISSLPEPSIKFDTVVSLAVLEHVGDPAALLRTLATYLSDAPAARIVITTPHPSVELVHDVGAAMGLFSKHANAEHKDLLDRAKLEAIARPAGLKLASYSRFLLGANQIAAYSKRVE